MFPIVLPCSGRPSLSASCSSQEAAATGQTDQSPSGQSQPANEIKAAKAVDRFFNLSSGSRFSSWDGLNAEERTLFITMVAELAKQGLIGYEVVEIDNRPHKSFITTQTGDTLTSHAPLYDYRARYRWS